jgi:hypothetical protein
MPGDNRNEQRTDPARHRTLDIASQFPDALTSGELDQVTHRVERLLSSIAELRRRPLTNADEPAPVFRPVGKEQP